MAWRVQSQPPLFLFSCTLSPSAGCLDGTFTALKLEITTTELRKGLNLAWYHHLTHIACVQKLRGLRQKLDALRVQTGPSHSKYKGLKRKLICFKHISFF